MQRTLHVRFPVFFEVYALLYTCSLTKGHAPLHHYRVLAGLALLDDVRIFYGRHMEKVRVWRAADEEEAADREGDSNLRDMPTDTVRSRTMVSGLYGGIETGTAG